MRESLEIFTTKLIYDLADADIQLVLLAMLAVATVIVLDAVTMFTKRTKKAVGMEHHATAISIDGSKDLPAKVYVSEALGLAGKPDALIEENGFIIPVERKPLAKKLRDRYVAQLLVYMRLIEEIEGARPPYGYLVLGPQCRRVKIENSPQRQAWLQRMVDEMREVLAGAPTHPTPHPKKCAKCDVRAACDARADVRHDAPVKIGAGR